MACLDEVDNKLPQLDPLQNVQTPVQALRAWLGAISSKLLYDHAGAGLIFGSLRAIHQVFNNRRFDPKLRSSAFCIPSPRPFYGPS
jgi:hypothetical protein